MKAPHPLRVDSWKIWHAPDFDPAELVRALAEPNAQQIIARFERAGDVDGYWKGAPLRLKTALRYQAKAKLLGLRHPRRSEYNHLLWLRERLFAAPRPLAVGEWHSRGLVRYQWLFTERMPNRVPWSECWVGLSEARRKQCILHLADEVARMHSLHFVHHDLFPRNLMVADGHAQQPIAFLDAWAGGPRFSLRGPSYDIACLTLDWPETWRQEEQALFLNRYLQGRMAQGKAIRNVRGWLSKIKKQRSAWVRKLQASPRRRGGRPVPSADWDPPALG